MQSFFFFVGLPNGWPWSQALLAETVKTGDKNRDDFRCLQMSIVKSMRFNFGDDRNNAQCLSRSSLVKFFSSMQEIPLYYFFRPNRLRFTLI